MWSRPGISGSDIVATVGSSGARSIRENIPGTLYCVYVCFNAFVMSRRDIHGLSSLWEESVEWWQPPETDGDLYRWLSTMHPHPLLSLTLSTSLSSCT